MSSDPCHMWTMEELSAELQRMKTPRGLQASSSDLFRAAIFGRDSLWTARFVPSDRALMEIALKTTGKTQGLEDVLEREEGYGKIAHEMW